jgi:hypothetical protein
MNLVGIVFSGLSAMVIEDAGEVIRVRARTSGGAFPCPGGGTGTANCTAIRRGQWRTFPPMVGRCWWWRGCGGTLAVSLAPNWA